MQARARAWRPEHGVETMIVDPDALSKVQRAPVLMRRIAFARFDFDVLCSDARFRIAVEPGRIGFRPNDEARPPQFTIRAPAAAWSEFAQATPRPGFNDVVALIESGHAEIEGDVLPFFRHLFFVKAVLAAMFKGDHGFALAH